jgi:glyoxylase-like metal-dependent hydrolase (beta-lactamase superfamily II)
MRSVIHENRVYTMNQTNSLHIINVGYSSTNYYVLEMGDARLLIDVGMPGSYGALLANLKRKDIAIDPIIDPIIDPANPSKWHLLVTHYHPDHAGVVEEVKAAGVRLIVMEPQVAGVALMQSYIKPDSGYIPIRLDDAIVLAIAESRAFLKGLGFDGEIAATPGHSDDSVSLVLDSGDAFIGDLTFPALATAEERGQVMKSWRELAALHATRIYSGHSPTPPVEFPSLSTSAPWSE